MNNTAHIKQSPQLKRADFTLSVSIVYIVLFAAMLLLTGKTANASTEKNYDGNFKTDFSTKLSAVGRGELTWLGLTIYQASLWTVDGKYQSIDQSKPIALAITYQKNIDSQALVERTVEEWEHLNIFDSKTRKFWGDRLVTIWPDVKPEDNITTLLTTDQKTRFYYNDKLIAELNEPEFGKALLSIWLDPNTSEPGLRKRLIGNKED